MNDTILFVNDSIRHNHTMTLYLQMTFTNICKQQFLILVSKIIIKIVNVFFHANFPLSIIQYVTCTYTHKPAFLFDSKLVRSLSTSCFGTITDALDSAAVAGEVAVGQTTCMCIPDSCIAKQVNVRHRISCNLHQSHISLWCIVLLILAVQLCEVLEA